LYLLGSPDISVVELSVGAGLVTVLFVFAINIAGEETFSGPNLISRPLAWILVGIAVVLLGVLVLGPQISTSLSGPLPGFAEVIWKDRLLDVVLQVLLIFAGVLGVLGLLSEVKNPSKEGRDEH
jgi:hypothetical protein